MSVAVVERKSILASMASRYDMEPEAFERVLRNTVAKPGKDGREVTREEFAACLVVANQYGLNPLTRELYFFPDPKRGTVVPVLGVDGWARIINERAELDGIDFHTTWQENGKPEAVTCIIYRKDRAHPTQITEYFNECVRDTDPWRKSPSRMLRHKALIQCARIAFGFAGLYDEDDAGMIDVTPKPPRPPAGPAPVTQLPRGVVPKPAQRQERAPSEGRSTEAYAAPAQQEERREPDAPTGFVDEGIDPDTGEIIGTADETKPAEEADPILDEARGVAMRGAKALRLWLAKRAAHEIATLEPHMAALNDAAAKAGA